MIVLYLSFNTLNPMWLVNSSIHKKEVLTGKRRVSFVFNGVEALPDLDISDNTPYITRNEKWKNIFNENGAFRQVSCCQPSV
jgi:hypothetical protein